MLQEIEIFKALSDESRLRIIHILHKGFFNVQEITSILSISQSTVSHHLKTLQHAGLVRLRREGTWSFYTLCTFEDQRFGFEIASSFSDSLARGNGNYHRSVFYKDSQEAERILSSRREDSKRFFDSVAKNWKELRLAAQENDSYLDELVKTIPDSGILVELGCGTGTLLEKIYSRRGKTIGIDHSTSMLDEAKLGLGSKAENIELRLGSLEHLPVADQSADMVVAYMVFHHLSTPLLALRDSLRILKPGGTLAIMDLTAHSNEIMRERYGDTWLGFDPKEFSSWIKQSGFAESRITLFGDEKKVFLLTATA